MKDAPGVWLLQRPSGESLASGGSVCGDKKLKWALPIPTRGFQSTVYVKQNKATPLIHSSGNNKALHRIHFSIYWHYAVEETIKKNEQVFSVQKFNAHTNWFKNPNVTMPLHLGGWVKTADYHPKFNIWTQQPQIWKPNATISLNPSLFSPACPLCHTARGTFCAAFSY